MLAINFPCHNYVIPILRCQRKLSDYISFLCSLDENLLLCFLPYTLSEIKLLVAIKRQAHIAVLTGDAWDFLLSLLMIRF